MLGDADRGGDRYLLLRSIPTKKLKKINKQRRADGVLEICQRVIGFEPEGWVWASTRPISTLASQLLGNPPKPMKSGNLTTHLGNS